MHQFLLVVVVGSLAFSSEDIVFYNLFYLSVRLTKKQSLIGFYHFKLIQRMTEYLKMVR